MVLRTVSLPAVSNCTANIAISKSVRPAAAKIENTSSLGCNFLWATTPSR
ncbi:unannotated protein [freshwater metagenome]|uniref:Unannotated protein n=1 Tax=freshwater metagenome TaxID=449393 RepID=A0A6J6PMJ7_9ZZZZ